MADSSEPWRPTRTTSWVARVLGPLALIVAIIAVIVVVSSSTGGGDPESTAPQTEAVGNADVNKDGPETPKEYVVQAGDSLTSIAAKFGVSVDRLVRLNPEIDPQTLNEGTPIILR